MKCTVPVPLVGWKGVEVGTAPKETLQRRLCEWWEEEAREFSPFLEGSKKSRKKTRTRGKPERDGGFDGREIFSVFPLFFTNFWEKTNF